MPVRGRLLVALSLALYSPWHTGRARAQQPAASQPASATRPAAAPPAFFATGSSRSDDPVHAATEAAAQVVKAFADAGAELRAVVFLERTKGVTASDGQRIGDAVKAVTKVPTFGTGATGPYGLAWTDAADGESSFLVLGLGGSAVDVQVLGKGGKPSFIYKPGGPTRDAKKEATLALWRVRGRDLASLVPADGGEGVALLLGTMHNWAHVELAHGFNDALPRGLTPIGGCGQWYDYVYVNGEPVTDEYDFNKPTPYGQMVVLVRGPFRVVAAGKTCRDTRSAAVVRADTAEAVQALREQLGGVTPAAILGFGCVTRLRDAQLPAQHERQALQAAFGDAVPLFGCYAGGEIGLLNDGVLDAGGDRLVLLALAPRAVDAKSATALDQPPTPASRPATPDR